MNMEAAIWWMILGAIWGVPVGFLISNLIAVVHRRRKLERDLKKLLENSTGSVIEKPRSDSGVIDVPHFIPGEILLLARKHYRDCFVGHNEAMGTITIYKNQR